jgi:ribonuclease HII
MKKTIALSIASAALMWAADQQTFTGTITDSMCDNADHKAMKMGNDPKCVVECVKGMGGKYVLYDGKTTYALSDQKTPAKFAAKKVTVTGTLDEKSKTIAVASIAAK